MKRILFFLALFPLMLQGQVQNSKLADRLLLEVLSGANALSGAAITSGTPTSGVTYQMGNVGGSSDFSASGAVTTANGVVFKADGDAPAAWDGAILRPINAYAGTSPDPSYKMTNSGAIPTYGHKGNDSYLAFDGVDDKIVVPLTRPAGAYTVIVRFRTNAIGAEQHLAEFKGSQFYITAGGKLLFGGPTGVLSNTTIISKIWHTAASVYDGTQIKIYLDDSLDCTPVTDAPVLTDDYITVGAYNGTNYYLSGGISYLSVFNCALSADSIAFYSDKANHPKSSDLDGSGNEATLILSPEGMISQSTWRDYYNTIDVAVGNGATSPRLVKSWAGMNAWRFNGSTSYLTKASAADNLTGHISGSFWINLSSFGEGVSGSDNYGDVLISYNGSNKKMVGYCIGSNSTGLGKFCLTRMGSTEATSATSSISLNKWYHIAFTSTLTGITNIYVNGVISGTINQNAGTPAAGTTLIIGNSIDGNISLQGCVENLKIWKSILSAEQIALSYGIYD
jgi:hypothetical protein